ncbi:uncharacterized protein LOC143857156 isoform X2 [Tasmannia lanceolata]|uniref:uncharacterized protein LOC143857156 isoform X2 n=1 Tax=Tasmannia lanceolata TaxID=3420 RepID=UPI00406293DB
MGIKYSPQGGEGIPHHPRIGEGKGRGKIPRKGEGEGDPNIRPRPAPLPALSPLLQAKTLYSVFGSLDLSREEEGEEEKKNSKLLTRFWIFATEKALLFSLFQKFFCMMEFRPPPLIDKVIQEKKSSVRGNANPGFEGGEEGAFVNEQT